jgi:hypothetical protein
VAAFVNDYFSIHDDYVNSFVKDRAVNHAGGVEYDDIGGVWMFSLLL